MGAVYLADDTQLGRQVALKLPSFGASESPQRIERFVREARASAALLHPHICTVFDAGQINGRSFISMAYIDGKPLDSVIDPDSPMPEARAAELVRKIANGLGHAHAKGIVHRDLKPANAMLTAEGEPVVMDFGLAKRVAETDANEARLTRDGAVIGTPAYMAPEQVRGEAERIGPATDVYALGVMLFEMLSGQTPYQGPLGVVLGQILSAPVPPLEEVRPGVDPKLAAICKKAMAKEPAERFKDMSSFAAALDRYLNPSKPPSVTLPPPVPVKSPFDQLEDNDTEVASHPARRSSTRNIRRGKGQRSASRLPWVVGGAIALLALICTLVVLVVRTKHGDVVIELSDPSAKVQVVVDGEQVELAGLERPLKLTAGEHGLTVTSPDFETITQKFTVKKGEKEIVKVTLKPKAAPIAKVEPKKSKEKEPDPVSPMPSAATVIPADAKAFGKGHYKAYPDQLTWKEAKARCEQLGGRLVVITSKEQNQFVSGLFAAAGIKDAWIGFTDEAEEGKWVWIDGSTGTYTNWFMSQPNNKPPGEHFAMMGAVGKGELGNNLQWSDQPNVPHAGYKPGFICEWITPPAPKTERLK